MKNINWRGTGSRTASIGTAAVVGHLFYMGNVPLAWVLGPLLTTAAMSIAGLPVFASNRSRRIGQLVIGTGLGLNITASLLADVLLWIPLMVLTTLIAITVTSFFSVFMARLSGLDRVTSYFALMPGGLSEMANIGVAVGGRSEPIALAQAVRLGLVVCVLPPTIMALGIHGDFLMFDAPPPVSNLWVGPLLLFGLVGVFVMRVARASNPWLLGALSAAALVSSSGLIAGTLPKLFFYGGQLLLGMAIGARFKRDIVARLPNLFLLMIGFTLVITFSLFFVGIGLSALTDLDLATAALASSAGGVVEMTLTAQALHLNVALILGFHVIRAIMVNGVSVHIYHGLARVHFFSTVERLEVAILGTRRG